MEPAYFADQGRPPTFTQGGREYLARAYKTTRNTVTAWWDASQIYGYDSISLRRVKRDPTDPAKLLMVRRAGRSGGGEQYGYLPVFQAGDPRSEEHTSELQSLAYLVCRLLLEKKKKKLTYTQDTYLITTYTDTDMTHK